MRRLRPVLVLALALLPATAAGAGPLRVLVSVPPQAEFVEQVGGDRVQVEVLVPAGQSPHSYQPTPRQLADLARTRAYFSVGVPFEARLLDRIRAGHPGLRVVDTRRGVPLLEVPGHGHHDHARGPSAEPPGGADPHIWLDPQRIRIQARNIATALGELDPPGVDVYEQNLARFEAALEQVDQRIAAVLAPLKGREFLVYHPAFGYFADRYGLRQVAVEAEGKEPGARQLARLARHARQHGIRVIFVQAQFPRKSAEVLAAEIGGVVVPLDPLARDVLANLGAVAAALEAGLR